MCEAPGQLGLKYDLGWRSRKWPAINIVVSSLFYKDSSIPRLLSGFRQPHCVMVPMLMLSTAILSPDLASTSTYYSMYYGTCLNQSTSDQTEHASCTTNHQKRFRSQITNIGDLRCCHLGSSAPDARVRETSFEHIYMYIYIQVTAPHN